MLTRVLILFFFITMQLGCSGASTKKPVELSKIEAWKTSGGSEKIGSLRLSFLQQTARSIGTQAGLSWGAKKINAFLESQKRNLDRIFNFNYLILNQNVLPPVLVESRETLNLADEFTVRISEHDYQIVQLPHFITTPPTWLNYMWMNYQNPPRPNDTLLPKNAYERRIWNANVRLGWNEGISQANQIFEANLARLKRDYLGMVLYRKLLAQRMITSPCVSQADLGVTGDGGQMKINDRVLRITAIPQLQSDTKNWRPVISKKDPDTHNIVPIEKTRITEKVK